MGIPVGGTLRIRKRYAVTHGQFPNQLPQPNSWAFGGAKGISQQQSDF
jgi:hypothetical protein